MLKTLKTIGSLACVVLSISSICHAQAMPTATARTALQVGGGYTYARPDYGQRAIQGISAFADYDVGRHFGAEADIHYVSLITPLDLAENSYLVGPRFILPHGRYRLYGKALAGVGDFVIQQADGLNRIPGTSFAYAIGGGLDIVATKHIVVRAADFEYQHWSYLTGLTPFVVTVGAAYRIR